MMDSGCDVNLTKDRRWISKENGKELDMIRSGGTLELNPLTAAVVEHAALVREHATFGTSTAMESAQYESSAARGFWAPVVSQLVPMVHCGASGG